MHRAPDPDLIVAGYQRYQEGGASHEQQRGDQRGFPAETVAVMAEDRCADGPREKSDGVNAEGFQRPDEWIGMGEVQVGEDESGDRAVEEEVIPFDGGPDGACQHCAAELAAVFSCVHSASLTDKNGDTCTCP